MSERNSEGVLGELEPAATISTTRRVVEVIVVLVVVVGMLLPAISVVRDSSAGSRARGWRIPSSWCVVRRSTRAASRRGPTRLR